MKARSADAPELLRLQQEAFTPLMDHYRDFDTSPAKETLEGIRDKMTSSGSAYWIMECGGKRVGALRVIEKDDGQRCRLSPVFVSPAWQGQGAATMALELAERLYPRARIWELDTIKEEERNCQFYEKLGYSLTGESRQVTSLMTLIGYRKEV